MKTWVKWLIALVILAISLAACLYVTIPLIGESKAEHGDVLGILLWVLDVLLWVGLTAAFFAAPTYLSHRFVNYECSKARRIVCFIMTLVLCPLIIMLIKPATAGIGHDFTGTIMDPLHKGGLSLLTLSELHCYPALSVVIGDYDCSWIIGFVILLIYALVVMKVNESIDKMDDDYYDNLSNVEHKSHIEVTDKITYTGIINRVEHHDVRAKEVDDTVYPIHAKVFVIGALAVGFILVPYATLLTLLVKQFVTLFFY